jgi:hypothetical protein
MEALLYEPSVRASDRASAIDPHAPEVFQTGFDVR